VEVNEVIIKFIDDYLHHLEVEANEPYLSKMPVNMGKMKVEKKPLTAIGKLHSTPRLTCPEYSKKEQSHQ
jgi:hypothetical protein